MATIGGKKLERVEVDVRNLRSLGEGVKILDAGGGEAPVLQLKSRGPGPLSTDDASFC